MCQGTTKSGKPCRGNGEPWCGHHKPRIDDEHAILKHPKAIRKHAKGPSKTDGPGHIYVYYLDSDDPDTYYKIGRTAKGVQTRLAQWGKECLLKKAYYVKNQKLAEALIHRELDKVRVYRYKIGEKEYVTVWKSTGTPVKESDRLLAAKHKLTALGKQVEWFNVHWADAKETISNIINLVNDTPTPHPIELPTATAAQ